MSDTINPQTLIDEYSLDEHLKFADRYFKDRETHDYLYQKPFHSPVDSGDLLCNIGQLFEGLHLRAGMRVLDFATGSCWLSKILVEFGCHVTACDASAKALSIGKTLFEKSPPINKNAQPPRFKVFTGERLDEENASFDRILVNDAFHHIPNTKAVLKEFYRLLKPGGRVGMSEPGRYHSQTEASQFEMKTYHVIENDLILEAIWEEAQSVGFDQIRITPILRNASMTMEEYLKLIAGGGMSPLLNTALQQNTINHSLFFLHKHQPVTKENFNETAYLKLHLDVALAVKQGEMLSGFEHYQTHGKKEGRGLE
jgi:ubiquinone/menaquinone biosynthesis C-methylase UbiE